MKCACVVRFTDAAGSEHSIKVEAESLFEAAAHGLCRLDSRFWTDDDLLQQDFITVEVRQEPTIHTVKVAKVKEWVKSHALNPILEEKKQELRRVLFGECTGK